MDHNFFRNVLAGLGGLLSQEEKLLIYRFLTLDKWHRVHEELILAFQAVFREEPENVYYIQRLVTDLPEYLKADYNVKKSFVRKCMYAISYHPKEVSMEILNQLSNSQDKVVKEHANYQLNRIR